MFGDVDECDFMDDNFDAMKEFRSVCLSCSDWLIGIRLDWIGRDINFNLCYRDACLLLYLYLTEVSFLSFNISVQFIK